MIYTSARWADEAHTMVIGWDAEGNSETVPADHTIFRCPDDGPIGFVNNGRVIEPYELTTVTLSTRIAKNAIWERATDAEATVMDALLSAQPVRIRRIYDGATHIEPNHELFGLLQQALTAAFGAHRAAELLAPTD